MADRNTHRVRNFRKTFYVEIEIEQPDDALANRDGWEIATWIECAMREGDSRATDVTVWDSWEEMQHGMATTTREERREYR